MPEGEVRYCTTDDGVRIAYCVEGEGTPFVMCPHIFESFSLEYMFPELAEIRRLLSEGHKVVRYDMRGTGLSQRDVEDVSHAALVRDLEAVVDATDMSGFALSGTAFSGARAVEYAARHPERVSHLLLWGGYVRFRDTYPEREFHSFVEFARQNWRIASQTFVDVDLRQMRALPEEDRLGFGKLLRQSVSGEMAAELLLAMYETADVSAVLSSVRVPTLVIDRKQDSQRAQAFASNIPNARLVFVTGGSSLVLENAQPGIDAIREFIGDTVAPETQRASEASGERSLRTVLFTDLVGHTEMMQRLGDEQGRAVLREHERITREVLKQHDGSEVKTMGDGFMASFGSVTKAVECAIALQRAFADRNATAAEPLHVRVGLNAGEPIAEDGDLFGATVILASRIAAQAGAGEILIPEPVRHLLAGKSFVFSDRGEFVPKGFDDAVRLYEVRWQS
jgi:class 3 adenylate cyclase